MTNSFFAHGAATGGVLILAEKAEALVAAIIGPSYPAAGSSDVERAAAREAYARNALDEVREALKAAGEQRAIMMIEPAKPRKEWRPVDDLGVLVFRWRHPSWFLISLVNLGWLAEAGRTERTSAAGR